MAWALIWSPESHDDLREIIRYISQDSPGRAQSFAYRLLQYVEMLRDHPEMGRRVPEHGNPMLREIIFRPYRIVYRLTEEKNQVEIVRVWHAARGTPEII